MALHMHTHGYTLDTSLETTPNPELRPMQKTEYFICLDAIMRARAQRQAGHMRWAIIMLNRAAQRREGVS